jgi:hypothetical protein
MIYIWYTFPAPDKFSVLLILEVSTLRLSGQIIHCADPCYEFVPSCNFLYSVLQLTFHGLSFPFS